MKIYTKTGDTGETGLFAGPRVPKDDPRIEAYGTVDELNAVIGVVRSHEPPAEIDAELGRIQNELFVVGAELATPDPVKLQMALIGDSHIAALELSIDRWEATLPPLRQFILPGGTPAAAELHFARTVCRKAERRVVTLAHLPGHVVSERIIRYLNRLSDWLFVASRAANHRAGQPETPWQKPD